MSNLVVECGNGPQLCANSTNQATNLSYTIPSADAPAPTHPEWNAERALFERYARTRDSGLRDRLVRNNERLVRYLASKFAGRGEPIEDLVQVGNIGLVKSIDRFDPSRGLKFTTYATVTIVGEIQRYFRDVGWQIKVPRAMQQLNRDAMRAKDALTSSLGRVPTVMEVAKAVNATEEATIEAIELSTAYSPLSLDSTTSPDSGREFADFLGADDPRIDSMVQNDDVHAALSTLGARERSVVKDYYFLDLTQSQIAERLGISQMQVSRLKTMALARLKKLMTDTNRREGI